MDLSQKSNWKVKFQNRDPQNAPVNRTKMRNIKDTQFNLTYKGEGV